MDQQYSQEADSKIFNNEDYLLESFEMVIPEIKNLIEKQLNQKKFNENEHRKISLHITYENEFGMQMKDVVAVFD